MLLSDYVSKLKIHPEKFALNSGHKVAAKLMKTCNTNFSTFYQIFQKPNYAKHKKRTCAKYIQHRCTDEYANNYSRHIHHNYCYDATLYLEQENKARKQA